MQFTKDGLAKLSTLTLYRLLLKNVKHYPSKNRFGIMMAIKEEFRDKRNISEEREIFVERKKAWMGVAHLQLYKEKAAELETNYSLTDRSFTESLNPKDKDFIYF